MGKSDRKKYDKYKDKKYYCSKEKRRSTSDSSSESDDHTESHRSRSRAHKHQHHRSRSPVEKKLEIQSVDSYETRHVSKDKRVAGERDRKRQTIYDDICKDESQKKSCHSRDEADQVEFSFQRYSYELKVFLRDEDLVPDPEDFLKFLKNYETVQKRAGGRKHNLASAETNTDANPLDIPLVYDKSHLVSIALTASLEQLASRLPPGSHLSQHQLSEFRDILLLYLDFKQKEKFTKLRKLRQSQRNLPIAQYKKQIVTAVRNENVLIIAGDTGCGKSTQVPQYLLEAGYKRIACTQPRRIACISLCKRVAFETLNEYGSEVGYQIRFEKSKTQHTRIVFITEGLLLRQVSTDPTLSNYDVLVLDEVHERHLFGDFLLGIVKCLLYQRSDLKVILMSATINIELFQDYFSEAVTIIQVPGRLYPIKLQYMPVSTEEKLSKSERLNPAPYVRIMQLIDEKYPRNEKGDLLIFLSGMSEISSVVEAAKCYSQKTQGWIVLPLHSTLSLVDQDKVFDYPPEGVRKCIVSTNIAETSVTIDGIRFVVDSGKVKEMSYDPVCKMQKLKEFWISQASAEQRKGRAGRTGPGVCYRLFSEEEYAKMDQYSTPEIQRVPLDSLLLQMVAMGLPDARKFPFIEPPPPGALTENEKLTTIGHMLSRLPVDISLGKMLIMGSLFHQVEPVLSMASALSVQTPFTNRSYRNFDCEAACKELQSDHGDPLTLLNAFREWLEEKSKSSSGRSSSRQWCHRRGLEEHRFYEMIKLRRQFKDLLQDSGLLQSEALPNENMTSAERSFRHGEVKLLRSMRQSYKEARPRKKRVLKLDAWEVEGAEVEEPGDIDIKDVEFRLSNNSLQVQNLLSGSTACSYKDLMMLKLILCSGLYPQLAIADEFNYCKSVSEQLFHTVSKPYVSLHPMGYFGNHPQILQLQESDIEVIQKRRFNSKSPVSSKHQLLCYLSLLETTKPFLVTTMRMPAAQTLLLFSQSIDTNCDFSKLVCDSWLQLEFLLPDAAMLLLLKAALLRNKWEQLLNLRLEATSPSVNNKEKLSAAAKKLEQELSSDLPQFMHTEIVYTLRRLLPADLKVMYVGPGENEDLITPNPFSSDWECTPHPKKGGVRVTPYITFNCVNVFRSHLDGYDDGSENEWNCPHCGLDMNLDSIQKLQHMETCKPSQNEQGADEEETVTRKPNSLAYQCAQCDRTLYLTPTEILRHKKQHQ
ncbi:probable ATP-dependent RNA helicase DHX34 isoform X2 [Cryptotermes secundus]|uniref:probable ATP-dependent RNA helicase DHX34 isoform X2 n=1 Tax=Cryptotermes secundus TaxID=105785 RepID=UPI001454C798|nr:probable ATP-dependent RNA helicase DHX34 isoform X2 [Cryptotermes secundus]